MTSFGIEEATANGSLALKHTYLRYLDPYEKVHFHREEEETNDDWADAEDSRLSRHKKAKVESTVPSNYNYRYVHLLILAFCWNNCSGYSQEKCFKCNLIFPKSSRVK